MQLRFELERACTCATLSTNGQSDSRNDVWTGWTLRTVSSEQFPRVRECLSVTLRAQIETEPQVRNADEWEGLGTGSDREEMVPDRSAESPGLADDVSANSGRIEEEMHVFSSTTDS